MNTNQAFLFNARKRRVFATKNRSQTNVKLKMSLVMGVWLSPSGHRRPVIALALALLSGVVPLPTTQPWYPSPFHLPDKSEVA
jgi:hypothetical protein